jgi:hypothetical protein
MDLIDYRGLQILSPDPTGDGGLAIQNDLKELANRAGPIHQTAGSPTVDNDSDDTAGIGVKFYQWSHWLDTSDNAIYVCTDATPGAAVWLTGLPNARTISTTAPLTGGGDLSANRTLAITETDATHDGYLSSADWNTFNGKGVGSVTSVALTAPAIFSVAGSPITSTGTLAVTLATQSANAVWAGPTSGGAAMPTFRALVAADIPTIAQSQVTSLTTDLAAKVPATRTLTGSAPITIDGDNAAHDLSANRTVAIAAATSSVPGSMSAADKGKLDKLQFQGANVASASTTNIGAATGEYIHITGTTTITAFDNVAAGIGRKCVFDGVLTLTHNATSLILLGSNIVTAAGDCAEFESEGSGNWRLIAYQRASGAYLVSANNLSDVANRGSSIGNLGVVNDADLFGDGSDGSLTISADTNVAKLLYQFTNLTIDAGKSLICREWRLSLLPYLIIKVNGTLTLNGSITANGVTGFASGAVCSYTCTGSKCSCSSSCGAWCGGLGPLFYQGSSDYLPCSIWSKQLLPIPGGGGGFGCAAPSYFWGLNSNSPLPGYCRGYTAVGCAGSSAIDTNICVFDWVGPGRQFRYAAGAGGGFGCCVAGCYGMGGNGGGIILIHAKQIVFGASAIIQAKGEAGTAATYGGGGGGGHVEIWTNSVLSSGDKAKVSVAGGAGGTGSTTGGGAGADGIKRFYSL